MELELLSFKSLNMGDFRLKIVSRESGEREAGRDVGTFMTQTPHFCEILTSHNF